MFKTFHFFFSATSLTIFPCLFVSSVKYDTHAETLQNTKRVLDIAIRVFDCGGVSYKIVPAKGNVVHSTTEDDTSFLLENFSNHNTFERVEGKLNFRKKRSLSHLSPDGYTTLWTIQPSFSAFSSLLLWIGQDPILSSSCKDIFLKISSTSKDSSFDYQTIEIF